MVPDQGLTLPSHLVPEGRFCSGHWCGAFHDERRRILWLCDHEHPSKLVARRCAKLERLARCYEFYGKDPGGRDLTLN